MKIYGRLLRWLGHKRWFAAMGRWLSPIDRLLYRLTRGKLTTTGPRIQPTLLLTTIGRKTGRERTTPVMYLRDATRFVVSCENFGQKRQAAWPLNLEANSQAKLQIGRRTTSCLARPATQIEVDRYWPEFLALWPAHGSYLVRSGVRRMFILEPIVSEASARSRGAACG